MTHDPLCPAGGCPDVHVAEDCMDCPCHCDLIAQVVKREQEKASKVTTGGTFGPGVDGVTDAEIAAFLEQI